MSVYSAGGNECYQASNFNYMGVQLNADVDVSDMQYVHMSLWTDAAFTAGVYIIKTTGGTVEQGISVSLAANTWNEVYVPLSDYTNMQSYLTQIGQLKIDGGGGGKTLYIDNVYFTSSDLPPSTYPTPSPGATFDPLFTSGTYEDKINFTSDYGATFSTYSVNGHGLKCVETNGGEVCLNNYDNGYVMSNGSVMHVDVYPQSGITTMYFKVYTSGGDKTIQADVTPGQWNELEVALGQTGLTIWGIRFMKNSTTNYDSGLTFYFTNLYAYVPSTISAPTEYPVPHPQGSVWTIYTKYPPYGDPSDVIRLDQINQATVEEVAIEGHNTLHFTGNTGDGNSPYYIQINNDANRVDLNVTNFTRLHLHLYPMDGIENLRFFLMTEASGTTAYAYTKAVTPGMWNDLTFDISALSHLYSIWVTTYDGTNDTFLTDGKEFYIANYYFDDPTATIDHVDIYYENTPMEIGDTKQFTNRPWSTTNSWLDGATVTYEIVDASPAVAGATVATIDATTGLVTAVHGGTFKVKVTATYNGTTVTRTSDAITVNYIPQSPAPSQNAKDVLPLYGTFFGSLPEYYALYNHPYTVPNLTPTYSHWGSTGAQTAPAYETNSSMNYWRVDFSGDDKWFGMCFGGVDETIDASDFDRLHVDIYVPSATTLNITPQTRNADNTATIDHNDGDSEYQRFSLSAGWNTIDINLTSLGTTYTDFVFSKFTQIGFSRIEVSYVAVDNVYFYKSAGGSVPATTDNDNGLGMNWNTATGTTDYIYRALLSTSENAETQNITVVDALHNGNYKDHARTQMGVADRWLVMQLYDQITVSDVELVWAQGYAKAYTVYGTNNWPVVNDYIDTSGMTQLYSRSDVSAEHDPFYDAQTGLNNGSYRFVVVHFTELANASTFPYMPHEVHVGARTATYNTVDIVGMVDQYTRSGYDNMLRNIAVVPMNSRRAVLSGSVSDANVTCSDEKVHISKNNDGTFNIWASDAGQYELTISGSVDGSAVGNGTGNIIVYKSWTGDRASIVQADGVTATASQTQTNNGNYPASNVTDGKESEDQTSRWATNDGEGGLQHQWLLIDLQKEYALTDLEVVWENAYSSNYSVYGFKTVPDMSTLGATDDATNYNTWMDANSAHLIYKNVETSTPDEFPWHDSHIVGETVEGASAKAMPVPFGAAGSVAMTSTQDNQARYIAIIMNERGSSYGYSIWEVYAYGNDVTALNHVQYLTAPDMTIQVNTSRLTSVTAVDNLTTPNEEYTIEKFRPVTFVIKKDGVAVDDSKVTIVDMNDGYYNVTGLETGTYTVEMSGTNGEGTTITGSFTLRVINKKAPMALTAGTTASRHVYDDGYYKASVLQANSSKSVTIVDLTQVDFGNDITTEEDGDHLDCSHVELPAPRNLKNGSVQMNPNAVYYTDESEVYYTGDGTQGIHGENLAFLRNDGSNYSWYIYDLRLYDYWPYALETTYGTTAKRARFWINVPKGTYTLVVPPFPMWYHKADNKGANDKGVKFYAPSSYDAGESRIYLTEVTQGVMEGSNFAGRPFIITTDQSGLDSSTGYGCVLQSYGYNTTLMSSTEVSINTTLTPVVLDGGATFMGSYDYVEDLYTTITNAGTADPYRFLSQQLVPMPEEYVLTPFYGYLTIDKATPAAKPNVMLMLDDGTLTGLDDIRTAADDIVDVYSTGGMLLRSGMKRSEALRSLAKGIYVINGEKVVKK